MAIKSYNGTIIKDDISYVITENNELVVMNGRKTTMQDVVIPSEIDGIPVTGIVEWAFSRANVQNITIPETVTFIGQSAFEGCANLEAVLFDAPEVSLAYKAFANCTKLKIIRGNNINVKSDSVFWKCFSLERIYAVFTGSIWSKTFGFASAETVIVATPFPTALITPLSLTVATELSLVE